MDVPVLVCTEGKLAGTVVTVPDGGLAIGRADDNDIILDDDGVSRFHAKLLYDNGSLWLQDVGSRNGIFANDARVTGHRALKVGDVIRIAEHEFEVRWRHDVEEERALTDEPESEADPKGKKWRFWPFS